MDYNIDDVHDILEEICEEIPKELFIDLNGGIILLDEIKYYDKSADDSLLVLGTYSRFGVRRQINIYYRSIKYVYPKLSRHVLYEKLRDLLMHELQHHTEYKAKVKDLILEDEKFIRRILNKDSSKNY